MTFVLFAEWELLEAVAGKNPGATLPLSAAVLFGMAAIVVLHTHTARYADAALILAMCCLGIAIPAAFRAAMQAGSRRSSRSAYRD